jgi:hypothetical protein
MFVLSIFETIGLPLTMDEFSWSPADVGDPSRSVCVRCCRVAHRRPHRDLQADAYNGVISGIGGLQSVIFFMSAKHFVGHPCPTALQRLAVECVRIALAARPDELNACPGATPAAQSAKYGERKVLAIGLVFVVIAQLAAVPYAGKRLNLRCVAAPRWVDVVFRWCPHCAAPPGRGNYYCCDDWCKHDPELSFGQYVVSAILGEHPQPMAATCSPQRAELTARRVPLAVNIGFPLASVMIFTLFSFVLGPFHQGSWMGIINGCGSLARIVGVFPPHDP